MDKNNFIEEKYLENPMVDHEIVCPKCGYIHKNSHEYIPESCGNGDEYYIDCENCKEFLTVDVIFDEEYYSKNPNATFNECLKGERSVLLDL
jgi:hypothetical protein